jgi:hypothetical protein
MVAESGISLRYASPSPTISAPRKVSGRLRNRPTAAAENAVTISRVRVIGSRFWMGAMRMPAMAARAAPSAHENIETSAGRPPLSWSSDRSSTTARIVTPTRVRLSSTHSATATRRATPTMMSRCTVTAVPKMSTVLAP